ncbi:MAG: hypothetical protein U9P79_10385 [Candidatus Cloacimonadota bacterium]|nr:hypothetical protein [Candidatus Cloacimonadota bacterium]
MNKINTNDPDRVEPKFNVEHESSRVMIFAKVLLPNKSCIEGYQIKSALSSNMTSYNFRKDV